MSKQSLPFRRILSLARPERNTILLGIFFLAIASSMELAYPQAVRWIIDEALGQKRADIIDQAALVMIAILLFQSVSVALRFYLFTLSGERVVTRLREALYGKLLAQEVAFFDQNKTGELTSRLASDTSVLQNTVSVNISMALRNLASAIGGICLLLYTSPILTLLMLSTVPPVAIGAVYMGRRIRKLSKESQDALAASSEVAEETLSGLRTVRSFTREAAEEKRYQEAVWRSFDLAKQRAKGIGLFSAGAAFAGFGSLVVVFWYGGRLVIEGALSVGALTSFLMYTLFVAVSLGALAGLWTDFMRAIGSADRVFELLDREPSIPNTGGDVPAQISGELRFENVRFAYPSRSDVTVLQDVSFSVKPGEVVALVGHSGSGKSTMASLLSRFYDPNHGTISLDGQDLRTLDAKWLRQQIGIVAQEPLLFSCSVEDNIRYGRDHASEEEVRAAAKAANADGFIQNFPEGYRTAVGERGVQLSGGQKQRVAIARAVLKNPSVLILDEATSALDTESEFLVKEALERLMKGRTTLVIAHRLSTVRDADRVLVISDGKIVQSGSHDALMQEDGVYRRLVQRQFVTA